MIYLKNYAPIFESSSDAEDFPVFPINSFHWEKVGYSRPESYAALYAVENEGIHAVLWTFEENLRCECKKRDDPVYTDSCLEFFVMPVEGDSRYMNFEVNPKGIYLSQIGIDRESRRLIKELTDIEPIITPLSFEENEKTAWGCNILIPCELISELYGVDFKISESTLKCNFYKCADFSETPHFGAAFPVTTAALGFHNPDCFRNIIIRKA